MFLLATFYACILFILTVTVFFGFVFYNPYKLYMVFGKKGTGKSTLLCKLAYQYSRKGYTVYCTQSGVPNTICIDVSDIGTKQFARKSVLLVEEVSLIWSNRDFKTFSKPVETFFRKQRHKMMIVYLFSQTFDIDKKVRDLVDVMYLSSRLFNCIGYMKRINKNVALTKAESDRPSSIAENLQFDSILFALFGSRKFTWLPKYVTMFDSFEDDDLPPVEGIVQPTAEPLSLIQQFRTFFSRR